MRTHSPPGETHPGLRRSGDGRVRPSSPPAPEREKRRDAERQSACGTRSSAVAMAGFTDALLFVLAILPVVLRDVVVFAAMDLNAGKKSSFTWTFIYQQELQSSYKDIEEIKFCLNMKVTFEGLSKLNELTDV